ncbi:ribonuclease HII [uncultured Marivirga sp.]|uniref:ribonuclease HII n=1 Tax=uncultured Marivirga sp. TaxID=1123707 RepID=UPI0030EDDB1D|tara:strand:+ start:290400 stop:291023 length:624 start_codon:yes stop_codon:yes gene_type:complete
MSLKAYFNKKNAFEAGCDEVGRGCLAGPVVASAVILPQNFTHPYLTDSKQLSSKKRGELVNIIKEKSIAWAVAECSPEEIDEVNILNASFWAMHKAIDRLTQKPDFLLIDGNRFTPYQEISHECIIKGDSKYFCIAAASILAKEYRDNLMRELSDIYPQYGWERNVGYPTKQHREGIKAYGITEHHRKSFQLLPRQLEIFGMINKSS